MKIFLTVTMLLLVNTLLFSQAFVDTEAKSISNISYKPDSESYKKHSLYLEGSFVIQSLNFETTLYSSKSNLFRLNGRLGLGYYYFDFFGVTQSAGGLGGLTFLLGRKNHRFETSLGGFVGSDHSSYGWFIGTLGYRYQKPDGRFMFRLNIGTLGIGIGLGYAF